VTRLQLGTAQWGQGYGVTNAVGRLSDEAIADIVAVAREWDIDSVDTAMGSTAGQYGDAQARLRPFAHDFAITTKVAGAEDVTEQVLAAQRQLGVDRLHAVLVHDWDALEDDDRRRAVRSLGRLLDSHGIERAGVSVYDEAGVSSAIETFASRRCPLTAVQVPANLLDRRLERSAPLIHLHQQGAEIVVRSAFLQGVLLAASSLPGSAESLANHPDVCAYRDWCLESDPSVSLASACLSHVRALPWATHVVVGVTSSMELTEICEAWHEHGPKLAPDSLGSSDLDLIDPRRW